MSLRHAVALGAMVFGAFAVASGCGARSALDPCLRDQDCTQNDLCAAIKCIDRVCTVLTHTVCDDKDPCTTDSCDKHTGNCVFQSLTNDLDGDGHHAPLPGFNPGAPGSCGDDCDDTNAAAFPGNKEICDGVDNDCDGIVDNGASYVAGAFTDFQLSTPGFSWAEPESITRGTSQGNVRLLATYGASLEGQFSPYVQPLDQSGQATAAAVSLTGSVAAGSNTAVAWTGDRFGIAWGDRRDGNFEVYFALLDPTGKKMAPGDERITISDGFSLYPSITWTGQEFVIVWQEEVGGGNFTLQGQRIDLTGHLIGDIASLTPNLVAEQGPTIASGRTELGVTWVRQKPTSQDVLFQPFGFDLVPKAKPLVVNPPSITGQAPTIAFNQKNYVVAFYDSAPTKRTVYGAIVAGDGSQIVAPTNVGESPAQTRDPALLPLGDRILFVYADDQDQNQGYELYARTLAADLSNLGPPARVTNAAHDSVEPHLAFAPNGTVLVLFRDDRGPNPAVFETGLKCVMPTP